MRGSRERPRRVEAVHHRHRDVEQHQLRLQRARGFDRGAPVVDGADEVEVARQQSADALAHARIVVGDQAARTRHVSIELGWKAPATAAESPRHVEGQRQMLNHLVQKRAAKLTRSSPRAARVYDAAVMDRAQAFARSILLFFLTFLAIAPAGAQTLAVQGDHFTVDGAPRFLVFTSYFGAMAAGHVPEDLKYLRSKGFAGVRIWPNFPRGPMQLMRSDGSINPDAMARLLFILDRAREQKLVVDVSFTAEHVAGLDAGRFRDGILATTDALRGYDNLIFDIQNERNVYGPFGRPLEAGDVASIRAGIKSIHPGRIVTASNSSEKTAEFSADFASQTGLDVNAYHDPRTSQFYVASWVQQLT